MILRNPKFDAVRKPISGSISLYIMEIIGNQKRFVKNITSEPIKEGEDIESIDIPYESAQELMDSLWDCGLRPSEGSGSAGSLRATENHLKDMQKIVDRLFVMLDK